MKDDFCNFLVILSASRCPRHFFNSLTVNFTLEFSVEFQSTISLFTTSSYQKICGLGAPSLKFLTYPKKHLFREHHYRFFWFTYFQKFSTFVAILEIITNSKDFLTENSTSDLVHFPEFLQNFLLLSPLFVFGS